MRRSNVTSSAKSATRSRTSLPETGLAVVATRIPDCDRDISYPSNPKEM